MVVMSNDIVDSIKPELFESTTDHVAKEGAVDPFAEKIGAPFFATSTIQSQIDEVIHLCQFGGNVVTLLGDKGVGKTTFLVEARQKLIDTSFCCMIDSSLMMTADDVFKQIIYQLELSVAPSSNTSELLVTLRKAMSDSSLNRVVIVIDDAELLNDSILSALLSLFQGVQGGQFHLLLSGDKNLIRRLDALEIIDVLIYDIHINPFDLSETKEYIEFKLGLVGRATDEYFKSGEIDSIYKESSGFPSLVNKAAQKFMFRAETLDELDDFGGDRKTGLPLLHMGLLILLLAGLIMVLIYMSDDDVEDEAPLPTTVLKSPISKEAKIDAIDLAIEKLKAEKLQEFEKNFEINDSNTQTKTELLESTVNELDQGLVVNDANHITPTVGAESLEDAANLVQAEVVESAVAPDTIPEGGADLKQGTILKPEGTIGLDKELKKELESEVKSISTNDIPSSGQVKPEPNVASRVQSVSALSAHEKTVVEWPATHFTLQLIGAGQKASLTQFIAGQPNRSELLLVSLRRNGKPWYVVVTGVYENTQQARKAIQALPQNQVNGGPWPKKVSDLQRDIQSFRRK